MASKNLSLIAASLATLTISACGGGGGGSNTTQGSNDAPITITSSNANAVASLSASAVGAGVSSMQTVVSYVTGAEIQTTSSNTGGRLFNLQTIISSAVQRAFHMPKKGSVATGVAISDYYECAEGGSVSISGDVKNPDSENSEVGDQGTVTYNNCNEDGATMSGQMKITVTAVSGSYETAITETTNTSFTNFKVTQTGAATSLTINGTARSPPPPSRPCTPSTPASPCSSPPPPTPASSPSAASPAYPSPPTRASCRTSRAPTTAPASACGRTTPSTRRASGLPHRTGRKSQVRARPAR
jgi:hypothetical protein